MPNKIHTFHAKKAVEGVKTLPGGNLEWCVVLFCQKRSGAPGAADQNGGNLKGFSE